MTEQALAPQGTPPPRLGTGFSWAWRTFLKNWPVLIGLSAIIVAINLLQNLAGTTTSIDAKECVNAITGEQAQNCVTTYGGYALTSIAILIAGFLLSVLASIGLIHAALKLTRGEAAKFSDLWEPEHFWMYLLVTIVFSVCLILGFLCIVGGVFVLWIWQFCQYSVLDRGKGVRDALGHSFRLVMAHKGLAVVTMIVAAVAYVVSDLLWGIPGLVLLPYMILFMSSMYRQFDGQPLAD